MSTPLNFTMTCEKELKWIERLSLLLNRNGLCVFRYNSGKDQMAVFGESMIPKKRVRNLTQEIENSETINEEDRRTLLDFFSGKINGSIEIQVVVDGNKICRKAFDALPLQDTDLGENAEGEILIGCVKDITEEKDRQLHLEEMAKRDPFTKLYNRIAGSDRINEYLERKQPEASCGVMVIDIDYFKSINDNFGHLFGDKILLAIADVLRSIFDENDIIMRIGGDEFSVLVKDSSYAEIEAKASRVVETVREMMIDGKNYSVTCSVGVCYLAGYIPHYNFNKLLRNADVALYRAKNAGRNRFSVCDSKRRFGNQANGEEQLMGELDPRYFRGDIISAGFEIFEKTDFVDDAVAQLIKVMGIRYQLDRVRIVESNFKKQVKEITSQWVNHGVEPISGVPEMLGKADFMTLYQHYDEYGTVVVQEDDMAEYSEAAKDMLLIGGAKSAIYASMYDEGRYIGYIAMDSLHQKRYWSRQKRKELSELAKLIGNNLKKRQENERMEEDTILTSEVDPVTGLSSFGQFRGNVERVIAQGQSENYMMIYSDFVGFSKFNRNFGYAVGDRILKEYGNYFYGCLHSRKCDTPFFSRIGADQFIMLLPKSTQLNAEINHAMNEKFMMKVNENYPQANFRIRSGIAHMQKNWGLSEAMDAANSARKQVSSTEEITVKYFEGADWHE